MKEGEIGAGRTAHGAGGMTVLEGKVDYLSFC